MATVWKQILALETEVPSQVRVEERGDEPAAGGVDVDRDVPRLDVEGAREFLPEDLDALLARLRR